MPIQGKMYRFTKRNVDLSPEKPGVYALFAGQELIYYGEAHDGTIRSRLQRHQAGVEGACTQRATHYQREACDDPEAREVQLLREYKRLHGKLPRCNKILG
jgi:hypothetical protein